MIVLIPLLVAIIGLVIYLAAGNAKLQEIGRIMFAFGLLVTLLDVAPKVVSFLK